MAGLSGKIVFVLGGSGGIGSIACEALAAQGACVISMSRSGNPPRPFLGSGLIPVRTLAGDVSDFECLRRAFEELQTTYGGLDILINAVGIQSPIGRFWDVEPKEWQRNIEINLVGTFAAMKFATPLMRARGKGKIINLSGGGATGPRGRFSAYAAAKAAIVRLTETAAVEYENARIPITVNAIAPGAVATRMTDEVLEHREQAGEQDYLDAEKTRLRGGTSPQLLAEFFAFLAGGESDGLTGRLISVLWDDWKSFPAQMVELSASSLYTLRRIDNRSFFAK